MAPAVSTSPASGRRGCGTMKQARPSRCTMGTISTEIPAAAHRRRSMSTLPAFAAAEREVIPQKTAFAPKRTASTVVDERLRRKRAEFLKGRTHIMLHAHGGNAPRLFLRRKDGPAFTARSSGGAKVNTADVQPRSRAASTVRASTRRCPGARRQKPRGPHRRPCRPLSSQEYRSSANAHLPFFNAGRSLLGIKGPKSENAAAQRPGGARHAFAKQFFHSQDVSFHPAHPPRNSPRTARGSARPGPGTGK